MVSVRRRASINTHGKTVCWWPSKPVTVRRSLSEQRSSTTRPSRSQSVAQSLSNGNCMLKRPPREIKLPMLETKINESYPMRFGKRFCAPEARSSRSIYCIALAYDGEGNGVLQFTSVSDWNRAAELAQAHWDRRQSIPFGTGGIHPLRKALHPDGERKVEKGYGFYNQLLEAKPDQTRAPSRC